jgi:phosphoribosylcarboxyaminoimidazole (NCAIR) mutase
MNYNPLIPGIASSSTKCGVIATGHKTKKMSHVTNLLSVMRLGAGQESQDEEKPFF